MLYFTNLQTLTVTPETRNLIKDPTLNGARNPVAITNPARIRRFQGSCSFSPEGSHIYRVLRYVTEQKQTNGQLSQWQLSYHAPAVYNSLYATALRGQCSWLKPERK